MKKAFVIFGMFAFLGCLVYGALDDYSNTRDGRTQITPGAIHVDGHRLATTTEVVNVSNAFVAADSILRTDLTNEYIRATNAEAILRADLTNEYVRATNAEAILQANIDTSSNALHTAITTEVARAEAAESTLRTDLTNEYSRGTNEEYLIRVDLTNEYARATNIEFNLQANIDTLSNATDVVTGALHTAITTEVARAEGAEGVLRVDLTNEYARATNEEYLIRVDLTNEYARATNEEHLIRIDLTNEYSRATNAEFILQANIDASSNALYSGLTTEVARAEAAELVLRTDLTNEYRRATNEEYILQFNIDTSSNALQEGIDTNLFYVGVASNALQTGVNDLQEDVDTNLFYIGIASNALQDGIDTNLFYIGIASNAFVAADTVLRNELTNTITVGSNHFESTKLNISGGTMTGPLTNEFMYYGDGGGLTNLAAPTATNSDALGNQSAATWAAATNALNLFQGAQIISNVMFSAEIGTNTAEGVAQALTNAMLSAQIGTNTATGVAQALTNTMLSAHISTNTAEGVAQGISNAMFTAHISTNKTVSEAAVPKAGGIMTGGFTNVIYIAGNGAGLTNLSVSETNAINTSIDTLNLATNANNSAITNNYYEQSRTNADFEGRISGASGFPLTNDVSLAGYAVSNGVLTNVTFYGDGVGMTNVPGTDTNYIAFFGESNVEVRVSSTNIYFGAPQIANNIADIASGSNRAVGVEQTLGGEITNNLSDITEIKAGTNTWYEITNTFRILAGTNVEFRVDGSTNYIDVTNATSLGGQSAATWEAATNANNTVATNALRADGSVVPYVDINFGGQGATNITKLQLVTSPSAGAVLVSDADGDASWQLSGVPVGSIQMYGGATAPAGWLLCDGTAVGTNSYSDLFAVIGTTFGGATTNMDLPDMRGVFPKGAGTTDRALGTNGVDAAYSGTLGTYLQDKMQGHNWAAATGTGIGTTDGTLQYLAASGTSSYRISYILNYLLLISDGANGTPRVGASTEPQSLGLTYIIKY